MYYSAIGLLAVLILLIENQDVLRNAKGTFEKPAWEVYRKFLLAVLAYYVTDILWGFLESRKLTALLFADTTVYFIAMAVGVLFWVRYTVTYLDGKSEFGMLLVYAGRIVAGMITALAAINIFFPSCLPLTGIAYTVPFRSDTSSWSLRSCCSSPFRVSPAYPSGGKTAQRAKDRRWRFSG